MNNKDEFNFPPKFLELILKKLYPDSEFYTSLGDFAECFNSIVLEKGKTRATTWYIVNILKCLPHFIKNKTYWSFIMLGNYTLVATRLLKKHKTHSFINLIGFSIAILVALLSFFYVNYEFNFDKHNSNYNRIYRVIRETKDAGMVYHSTVVPTPLAKAMRNEFPEVDQTCRMRDWGLSIKYKEIENFEPKGLYADQEIFEIFDFTILLGKSSSAFNDKYSIALSEKIALKYFGETNPIGKVLVLDQIYHLKVTCVYKNLPANSHFDADFIMPAALKENFSFFGVSGSSENWGMSLFYTYFTSKNNLDIKSLEKKFPALIKKYSRKNLYITSKYNCQHISDIHLYSHMCPEFKDNGKIETIYLYSALAIILLIIAIINYINLSTASFSIRLKEIGIRKIIGAEKKQVIGQLFIESLIITSVAFLIAFLLALIILPYFSEYVNRDMNFSFLLNSQLITLVLVGLISISIFSSLYPVLYLSSVRPLAIFSGGSCKQTNSRFRNLLVTTQFIMWIVLIFISLVINDQINFMTKGNLGVSTKNIINVRLNKKLNYDGIALFKEELLTNPNITNISATEDFPFSTYYAGGLCDWPGIPKENQFYIQKKEVDQNFIDLFGLEIIKGRNFSKNLPTDLTSAAIINETAAKKTGWEDPIGKTFEHSHWSSTSNKTIIGIVKDYHFKTLHNEIEPLYIIMNSESRWFSIQYKGNDTKSILDFIKKKVNVIQPELPYNISFYQDLIENRYGDEFRLQVLFSNFTFLTILISSLGLFGIISFTAETRKKEIGIRKVLGASSNRIAFILFSDIFKLIVFALIIAAPFAYLAKEFWLKDFSYKTSVGIEVYFSTVVISFIISIFALSIKVIKAASQNPVENLKYE